MNESQPQDWTLQEYANSNAAHILSLNSKVNTRAIPYDSAAEIVCAHNSALAAVRRPLVDALERLKEWHSENGEPRRRIDDALAKVKEEK